MLPDAEPALRAVWLESIAREDWGAMVVVALRQYFADGRSLLEPAVLLDAWSECDPDGVAVLLAIYQHPFWPQRTGLRRRLDAPPAAGGPEPGQRLAEWLAGWIAALEISEPLGRMYDLLVEDENGIFWWGDGYRDISEHPDFGGDMQGWLSRKMSDQGIDPQSAM